METGLTYTVREVVKAEHTALAVGSGDLQVLATPVMIALMERAAKECVIDALTDAQTTVGAMIDVEHLRPTPLGDTVNATAVLTGEEGSRLTFEVKAADSLGIVGRGTHVRYVVDRERFMNKLKERNVSENAG